MNNNTKPFSKGEKNNYCSKLAKMLCEFEGDYTNVTKRAQYKETLMLSGDTKYKISITYERMRDNILYN